MKPIVFSYTFVNDYENCPKKAFHKYVLRDVPYEETEAMRWGNLVHESFEKRIAHGRPLPKELEDYELLVAYFDGKPVGTELKVGMKKDGSPCGFFEDGVWCRGKIDVSYLNPPHGIFFDWKTGKKREDPHELEIQALLLQSRQPDVRVITGRYVWLQDRAIGKAHNLSDTLSTYKQLVGLSDTVARNAAVNHWPARENNLCPWCPVHSCQFNPKRGL